VSSINNRDLLTVRHDNKSFIYIINSIRVPEYSLGEFQIEPARELIRNS